MASQSSIFSVAYYWITKRSIVIITTDYIKSDIQLFVSRFPNRSQVDAGQFFGGVCLYKAFSYVSPQTLA